MIYTKWSKLKKSYLRFKIQYLHRNLFFLNFFTKNLLTTEEKRHITFEKLTLNQLKKKLPEVNKF